MRLEDVLERDGDVARAECGYLPEIPEPLFSDKLSQVGDEFFGDGRVQSIGCRHDPRLLKGAKVKKMVLHTISSGKNVILHSKFQ